MSHTGHVRDAAKGRVTQSNGVVFRDVLLNSNEGLCHRRTSYFQARGYTVNVVHEQTGLTVFIRASSSAWHRGLGRSAAWS